MTVLHHLDESQAIPQLPSLPIARPLLLVGHGTRNPQGRQMFIDFAQRYQQLDYSRPVFPCFLELTEPSIQSVVEQCVQDGYADLSALPFLLFAARHNKFDVTNELDFCRQSHASLQFHYGRHLGIAPGLVELWRSRLAQLDMPQHNPAQIPRSETVLLVVGRGASDPDAIGDVFKLARIIWEGSGYKSLETCFIGITHPRLEVGFEYARLHRPRRIIVLPHFLFTGTLMEKIFALSQTEQESYPDIQVSCLPHIGIQPALFSLIREREIEIQLGTVAMNCEMCKFRLSALDGTSQETASHLHHHQENHGVHPHSHREHAHLNVDQPTDYHQRIWRVP
ncbi:MAG: sirohydrochlorin chelatase [Cyanobacteria bacterium P01_F01_bin.42]